MLAAIRQMFRWAAKRQPWRSLLVDGNPADLVELRHVVPQGYVSVIRDRTLSADEIRQLRDIFAAMQAKYEATSDRRASIRPMLRETQLALWTCLATGCRIGELLMARWSDVDLDNGTWFVPPRTPRPRSTGTSTYRTLHYGSSRNFMSSPEIPTGAIQLDFRRDTFR